MKLTKIIPIFVTLILVLSTLALTYSLNLPIYVSFYWSLSQIVGQYIEVTPDFYTKQIVMVLSVLNFTGYILLVAYASSKVYSFMNQFNLASFIKKMKIKNMKDHIVVCGDDEFSVILAEELQKQKLPVVLVKTSNLGDLSESGVLSLTGSITSTAMLTEANIQKAKVLIAASKDPFKNAMILISARSVNSDIYAICRARTNKDKEMLHKYNANFVVTPEASGGMELGKAVSFIK